MSDGSEIKFELAKSQSPGSPGVKINDDLTLDGNYVYPNSMQQTELYYKYDMWGGTGFPCLTVNDRVLYESVKKNIKSTDIKLRKVSSSSDSSSSSGSSVSELSPSGSTYKTEVERTEALQTYFNQNIINIFNELAKDDYITKSNKISRIAAGIRDIKRVRKRWASGTKKFKNVSVISANDLTGSLSFVPSIVVYRFIRLYDYYEGHNYLKSSDYGYSFPSALIFNSEKLGFVFGSVNVSYWREKKGIKMDLGYYEATIEWIAVE